jgi:hypothetical protein
LSSIALGDVFPNIFRATTIALSTLLTLRVNKQRDLKVTRQNLLKNKITEIY